MITTAMIGRWIGAAGIVIRSSITSCARLMSMAIQLMVMRVVVRCCTSIRRANRTTRWLEPWRSRRRHGRWVLETRILDVTMIAAACRLRRRAPAGLSVALVLFALTSFRIGCGIGTRLWRRVLWGFHGWSGDGSFVLPFLHECSVILAKLAVA